MFGESDRPNLARSVYHAWCDFHNFTGTATGQHLKAGHIRDHFGQMRKRRLHQLHSYRLYRFRLRHIGAASLEWLHALNRAMAGRRHHPRRDGPFDNANQPLHLLVDVLTGSRAVAQPPFPNSAELGRAELCGR